MVSGACAACVAATVFSPWHWSAHAVPAAPLATACNTWHDHDVTSHTTPRESPAGSCAGCTPARDCPGPSSPASPGRPEPASVAWTATTPPPRDGPVARSGSPSSPSPGSVYTREIALRSPSASDKRWRPPSAATVCFPAHWSATRRRFSSSRPARESAADTAASSPCSCGLESSRPALPDSAAGPPSLACTTSHSTTSAAGN